MRDFYNIKEISNPNNYEVLVNKINKLPSSYIPNDLNLISPEYSNSKQYLRNIAQINFEKMAHDAKLCGHDIKAVSTYRSYDYQKKLFNNYVKEKGFKYASFCSAKEGHSEHQTGLAVDISDESLDYDNFDKTKEFKWVFKNAHKYGFILRYPKDKINITGYKYEPWHYRYVGNLATYLYENNLTLEEFNTDYL